MWATPKILFFKVLFFCVFLLTVFFCALSPRCICVCGVRYLLQFYYHRNERVFRNEDGAFSSLLREGWMALKLCIMMILLMMVICTWTYTHICCNGCYFIFFFSRRRKNYWEWDGTWSLNNKTVMLQIHIWTFLSYIIADDCTTCAFVLAVLAYYCYSFCYLVNFRAAIKWMDGRIKAAKRERNKLNQNCSVFFFRNRFNCRKRNNKKRMSLPLYMYVCGTFHFR